jgi:hypothetical protein
MTRSRALKVPRVRRSAELRRRLRDVIEQQRQQDEVCVASTRQALAHSRALLSAPVHRIADGEITTVARPRRERDDSGPPG